MWFFRQILSRQLSRRERDDRHKGMVILLAINQAGDSAAEVARKTAGKRHSATETEIWRKRPFMGSLSPDDAKEHLASSRKKCQLSVISRAQDPGRATTREGVRDPRENSQPIKRDKGYHMGLRCLHAPRRTRLCCGEW